MCWTRIKIRHKNLATIKCEREELKRKGVGKETEECCWTNYLPIDLFILKSQHID